MIALSQTKDGEREEVVEGCGEACFMKFRGAGKQSQCSPSKCMDNISGDFGLIINGHSLVGI